ncbi:uncharacterized protein LOC141528983 [Cotesia typhae]|uniref:uncharacterized protein LOC141528983 n=1 Tax=Cotesia typhae TaxID=2053667 RepID=UPI003D683ED3
MKSFLLCLIAIASFTLQGSAVPLPDGEVMVGVYYNSSSSPSVENKTEEIFENDPVDAIYLAINGENSREVTPLDPIEATEPEIEALTFYKRVLYLFKFSGSVGILNATDLKSNQTESKDSEFVDYLNVFGNNTILLIPFGNLTVDGSDSNETEFNSSEIDNLTNNVINSLNMTVLLANFTEDALKVNETSF